MKTTLHPQPVRRPVQRQIRGLSTRAGRAEAPEMIESPKRFSRSRLADVRRWVREWSYRLANNRYVFYGAILLAASLIAGAVTRGHEVVWRAAASLGIATVVIGLIHAWLDARSATRSGHSHTKGRVREW